MYIRKAQRGISLIELIMFMVIVSGALAGLLSVMDVNTKRSADPLIQKQALTIAESLLEEIELQNFSPRGFTGATTQANRTSFDDIFDYNGFATIGIFPADGSATGVTGLADYSVSVSVATIAWVTGATDAAQITVTVTEPNGQTIDAVGYRVNYDDPA